MLANELINRLERLGLLDQEIIEALREQLDQGGTRVTPEAVAKLLVDNGQLTQFQATKLIGELRSGQYEDAETVEEDDLTAGLEEPTVETVEPVEVEAEPVEVEAEPVEVEAVEAEPVAVEAIAAGEDTPERPANRPAPRHKKPDPQKSVWDSFKTYGYVGIIVLLLLTAFGLWFVLSREDADKVMAKGDEYYNNQNYQEAQDLYRGFLEDFGQEHEYSSLARTRITMTELYKAAQFKQQPEQAVELAEQKLPAVAEEKGMNEERGNLAALLVSIAENLASSASRADETAEKQRLLAELDKQLALMDNPLYMTASMRANLSAQIQNVMESRARVQREIDRNIQLDAAEASMKESLANNETKAAYDTRTELLRDFPELHDHKRLVSLILSASDIQQTLVEPSANLPETVREEAASDALRTIVLTNLQGREAPDLQGETLYFRAGGSVLAFEGATGKLQWRKFVGYSKELPPVRLDEGVLLSESASLEVLRCSAEDGEVAWRSKIDEKFSLPISDRDDVYVATESGRLIAIDAMSGDAKWATQIPQGLETGPGIDSSKRIAYQPGNHSNLYVINTRDGTCKESFYIGHKEGTIDVPPVPLLGHLFVIENAGADYANVHVLKVSDDEDLKVAQPLFRLTGNVRVPPIVQGRRLIVLTDRGEVVVYDIEPTAEREQVTPAATLPAFYEKPTSTQMAVGRSQMWITGTRLGRYELQINTGRVVRDWSIHELDTFIAQPYASDDTLVHARILRDTSAIRVTAANPKTGDEIWRTDVGVPVSVITPAPEGSGMHVVTSQAALFKLDSDSLASGSTRAPIENPGDQLVAIRFAEPIQVDENRFVMINQVGGETTIVYEPDRSNQKLRKVTMNLPSGKPTGGLISGGGLLLPLDSGRVVLMNWRNGSMLGAPFQPDSDPTQKVQWTDPVPLPNDPDQVVLADSRKKIYRLRVGEQVRELSSKDLEYEMMGSAAGVGESMIATVKGPSADFVVGFELATLNESFKKLLDQRVVWGPVAAGDVALLRTNDGMLRAFAADGSEQFNVQLPEGDPVGQPLMHEGTIVLAGSTGWLVTIDPAAGELLGKNDLGQPLSATPMLTQGRLLVPGSEGVVYVADIPGN